MNGRDGELPDIQLNNESTSEQVEISDKRSILIQRPLEISGRLVSAKYGYPLEGLVIQAVFLDTPNAEDDQHPPNETIIGTGDSGQGGDFQITFLDSPAVQQKICLLKNCTQVHMVLKVYTSTAKKQNKEKRNIKVQKLYFVSEPLDCTRQFPVNLDIPMPVKAIPHSRWKEFAKRLERAHLTSLHTIARQLLMTSPALSLFRDWDIEMRHSLLVTLEEAFLDPQGDLKDTAFKLNFNYPAI